VRLAPIPKKRGSGRIAKIPSFKRKIERDPMRNFKLVAGRRVSMQGSGFDHLAKITRDDILQKRDERLQNLGTDDSDDDNDDDNADSNDELSDRYVSGKDIIQDDISVAASKDIGYYICVILNSLYFGGEKNGEVGFRLFDGEWYIASSVVLLHLSRN
jgi:hypothetical protein